MSATPITKQIRVLDAGSWKVDVEEGHRMAACTVDLLNALLAVAKAAAVADLDSFSRESLWDLSCRLVDLEVDFRGWREWTP